MILQTDLGACWHGKNPYPLPACVGYPKIISSAAATWGSAVFQQVSLSCSAPTVGRNKLFYPQSSFGWSDSQVDMGWIGRRAYQMQRIHIYGNPAYMEESETEWVYKTLLARDEIRYLGVFKGSWQEDKNRCLVNSFSCLIDVKRGYLW